MSAPPVPAAPKASALAHFAAAALGVLPFYAMVIGGEFAALSQGRAYTPPSSLDVLFNLGLNLFCFGGMMLILLYYISGQTLRSLQPEPGSLGSDLQHGLGLGLVLLVLQIAAGLLLSGISDTEGPVLAVREIAQTLLDNPWQFALWFGPVIWLQGGLFEEFQRVFLLSRIWQVWPSPAGQLLGIVGGALLFGLGHLYEGVWGVPLTALIGATLSLHYWRYRRVLPLIIAHGIYNTVVLGLMVGAVRYGLI